MSRHRRRRLSRGQQYRFSLCSGQGGAPRPAGSIRRSFGEQQRISTVIPQHFRGALRLWRGHGITPRIWREFRLGNRRPARPRMKNSAPLLCSWLFFGLGRQAEETAPARAARSEGGRHLRLDYNYAIRQAREQIRQQEGVIFQVQAAGIPNVSAVGGRSATPRPSPRRFPGKFRLGCRLKASASPFRRQRHPGFRAAPGWCAGAAVFVPTTIDAARRAHESSTASCSPAKVRVQGEHPAFPGPAEGQHQPIPRRSGFQFRGCSAPRVSLANAQPDLITARNDYRIAIEQLRPVAPGAPAAAAAGQPCRVRDVEWMRAPG